MNKEYIGYLVSACEPGRRFIPEVSYQRLKSASKPASCQIISEKEESQQIEIPASESVNPQQSDRLYWIDFWIDGIDF